MAINMQFPDYDFNNDQEIFIEIPPKPNMVGCINCNKKFSKHNLELHQIIKHHILPYKCSKVNCNKSFIREEYLKEHIEMMHKKSKIQKPYKCNKSKKCVNKGIAFQTQNELNQHLMRHGPKKYICDQCGKAFAIKAYLSSHMRVHTGEKNYSCRICGRSFGSTSTRTYHENHLH
jgi:KRAB domain-containing zinc finger protein